MPPAIRHALIPSLTACSLALVATASRAEIAPAHRRAMQDKAPEAVMIKVIEATSGCNGGRCSVDATVEVLCVLRSAIGLAKGARIRIAYVTIDPARPMPGSPVPLLSTGAIYPAFLEVTRDGPDTTARPVAASASFSPLIDAGGGPPSPPARRICEY